MEVYYQGIGGSYSEQAIIKHFGPKTKARGVGSFKEVFLFVNKRNTIGVVPVENSITGSITENYDLLYKEKVAVIGEIYFSINHVLLVNEGVSLKEVTAVRSHPQALSQCDEFIRKHNLKMINEYDTAGAAKLIMENKSKSEAAIASEGCAVRFGMKILTKDIMNNKKNTTRFLVFVKPKNIPKKIIKKKTSVVFKTKHLPSALIRSLKNFSEINLTKIESRPDLESNWEYLFYLDFEGGIDDEKVKTALKGLKQTSEFIKVIGSYPKGEQ